MSSARDFRGHAMANPGDGCSPHGSYMHISFERRRRAPPEVAGGKHFFVPRTNDSSGDAREQGWCACFDPEPVRHILYCHVVIDPTS